MLQREEKTTGKIPLLGDRQSQSALKWPVPFHAHTTGVSSPCLSGTWKVNSACNVPSPCSFPGPNVLPSPCSTCGATLQSGKSPMPSPALGPALLSSVSHPGPVALPGWPDGIVTLAHLLMQ